MFSLNKKQNYSENILKTKRVKQNFGMIFIIVFTVCLFLGKLFFTQKPLFIAGYTFFIVSSASMEPLFPVNSLVIVKEEPFSNLNVGDAIVFKSDALSGNLAFHRIIRIADGGFYTKGDNAVHEDNQLITGHNYVGKEVYHNYPLGLYLSVIQRPRGFLVFFLLPALTVPLLISTVKNLARIRRKL